MNTQDIIFPIQDLIEWSFMFLELGENYVNYFLCLVIFVLLLFWTMKLVQFNKEEVPNR